MKETCMIKNPKQPHPTFIFKVQFLHTFIEFALLIWNVILQMYQIFIVSNPDSWFPCLYKSYSPKLRFADGIWTLQLFVVDIFLFGYENQELWCSRRW